MSRFIISLWFMLQGLLIFVKLTEKVDWEWWVIALPTLIPAAAMLFLVWVFWCLGIR